MPSAPSTSDLLACAIAAARTAGDHALHNIHRRGERLASAPHDVKLRLDVECQSLACGVIRAAYPDHALLGEEDAPGEPAQAPHALEWVVDPIDGTVNFSHGMPLWCCSVAVRAGEKTLAGAIYAPALAELFTATSDGPALRNGAPISVSHVSDLANAMVHTGLDKHENTGGPSLAVFTAITASVQRPRVLGCAALDLCRVAAGHADAYFESGIFVWDVAAAALVVERAGGRTETLIRRESVRDRMAFMATNGVIHHALRHVIRRALGLAEPLA